MILDVYIHQTKVYTITYLDNELDNITLNHPTSEWDISTKPENEVINQPLSLKPNNYKHTTMSFEERVHSHTNMSFEECVQTHKYEF